MLNLKEACESGQFVITAESPPPKGSDMALFKKRSENLLGKVHALNVTDNQAAIMRSASWPSAKCYWTWAMIPFIKLPVVTGIAWRFNRICLAQRF